MHFFRLNASLSNLRESLLAGNNDHLLNQARSDLATQELHVESLNKCIGEVQRQTEEERLALQDAQHGFVESRREQVRRQEDLSMKDKVLRNTQIRNGRISESARTSSGGGLSAINKRKSRDNSASHIAANARTDEFYE